jgi:hypothetical protein
MTDLDQAIRARLDHLYKQGGSSPRQLRAALLGVLAFHQPEDTDFTDADGQSRSSTDCATCDNGGVPGNWPCSTLRTIAEKLGIEHD